MKTKQFVGPFNNTPINLNLSGSNIVQIGIECPRGLPWAFDESIPMPTAKVVINGKEYIITEKEILEWENLSLNNPTIIIRETSPYVIVDISYE